VTAGLFAILTVAALSLSVGAGFARAQSQAVAAADTTVNVVSSASAGVQSSLFDCPPCKAVYVQVCTQRGFRYAPACELMQVCATCFSRPPPTLSLVP